MTHCTPNDTVQSQQNMKVAVNVTGRSDESLCKYLIRSSESSPSLQINHLPMPSGRNRGQFKGGGKRNENNRIYSNPLPVLFHDSSPRPVRSLLSFVGLSLAKIESPECEGFFDPVTRSVWVPNPQHSTILWRRGFFGKGDLSRSEPSWLARQKSQRKSTRSNHL